MARGRRDSRGGPERRLGRRGATERAQPCVCGESHHDAGLWLRARAAVHEREPERLQQHLAGLLLRARHPRRLQGESAVRLPERPHEQHQAPAAPAAGHLQHQADGEVERRQARHRQRHGLHAPHDHEQVVGLEAHRRRHRVAHRVRPDQEREGVQPQQVGHVHLQAELRRLEGPLLRRRGRSPAACARGSGLLEGLDQRHQ